MAGAFIVKILSFDQATLKTGYALFDEDALVEYGLINLAVKAFKNIDTDTRCRVMARKICEMIDELQPDLVVIEDVALQRNAKVLIQLSRIQGSIIGHCDEKMVDLGILKPSQWRKACKIKQAKETRIKLKELSQEFVEAKFGVKMTEDEADAVCIGYAVWAGKNKEEAQ